MVHALTLQAEEPHAVRVARDAVAAGCAVDPQVVQQVLDYLDTLRVAARRFAWLERYPRRIQCQSDGFYVNHPVGDPRRTQSFFSPNFPTLAAAVDYAAEYRPDE